MLAVGELPNPIREINVYKKMFVDAYAGPFRRARILAALALLGLFNSPISDDSGTPTTSIRALVRSRCFSFEKSVARLSLILPILTGS